MTDADASPVATKSGQSPHLPPQMTPTGAAKRHRRLRASPPARDLVADLDRLAQARERFFSLLPALASGGVFLLLAMKVLLVSFGNPATALAVVAAAGPLQVLAGVLVLFIPAFASFLPLIASSIDSRDLPPSLRRGFWALYGIVALIFGVIVPWYTVVILLIYPVVIGLTYRVARRTAPVNTATSAAPSWIEQEHPDIVLRSLREQVLKVYHDTPRCSKSYGVDLRLLQERSDRLMAIINRGNDRLKEIDSRKRLGYDAIALGAVAAIALPVLPNLINSTPWLSPQRLVVGRSVEVGYILASDQEWTTVLLNNTRSVIWLNTAAITGRTICYLQNSDFTQPETVAKLLGTLPPAHYPPCYPREKKPSSGSQPD